MDVMTDAELWLKRKDWRKMLVFLSGRWENRKAQLYLCAGLRSLWGLLYDERSTFAVEVAEGMADGATPSDDVENAKFWAEEPTLPEVAGHPLLCNAASIAYLTLFLQNGELSERIRHCIHAVREWPTAWLVREIIGNPFCPVSISPSMLAWNDRTIIRLAQAAYDDRILPEGTLDNAQLLILADALEEAGCTDEQILTHLRGGGEHYRGCWVIDLLLGKQ